MPIRNDEIERRSRLVSLVYEVLLDIETPDEEATTAVVLSALGRAFLNKATSQANPEATAPRKRPKSVMFSM
jgi:hypothetical protein